MRHATAYATEIGYSPRSKRPRSGPHIGSVAGSAMHEICLATGRLARAARRRDTAGMLSASRALQALGSEHALPKLRWHARAFQHWHVDEPLAASRLEALLAELDFAVAAALAQLGARLSTP